MRATLPLATTACTLAFVFGGCGSTSHIQTTQAAKATPPGLTPSERRMETIVEAWSSRLNAGDNAGIARLFSLPAVLTQGPFVSRFTTRREIAEWHSELPCSARTLSVTYRGRYATAVFRLGNRGALRCSGPGTLAAARFEIVHGKIASWTQVPVPPGQRPPTLRA